MNNLTDLREQIQEDILTCAWATGPVVETELTALCQIVVDRVAELQENMDNE